MLQEAGEVGNHDGEQLPRWGGPKKLCVTAVLPGQHGNIKRCPPYSPCTHHSSSPSPPQIISIWKYTINIHSVCTYIFAHISACICKATDISFLWKKKDIIYIHLTFCMYSKLYGLGRLGNTHSWGGLVEVETVLLELVGREVRNGDKECSFFCLHLLFFHYSFTHQPHYVLRSHNS